ncbi:outer membrane lipoprotein-sorting protein [Verrucomicrobiota bacterium sgz303538]
MLHLVKSRLLVVLAVLLSGSAAFSQVAPDAREILKSVRLNQASQHQTLTGQLRTGPKRIPFRLVIDGPVIRYDFANPPQSLLLRLGENSSTLEEIKQGEREKVTPARYDTPVRDTDLSYEDVSLRFLYWPNARVEGEDTMLTQRCWVISVTPGKADSQYSRVKLWITKESGTLLQAEAYDQAGNFARRFSVKSGQKVQGQWFLKSMRIESAPTPGAKDRTPTYLEVQKVGS